MPRAKIFSHRCGHRWAYNRAAVLLVFKSAANLDERAFESAEAWTYLVGFLDPTWYVKYLERTHSSAFAKEYERLLRTMKYQQPERVENLWKQTKMARKPLNICYRDSLHTGGVTGSIPLAPTIFLKIR
jgi:hypothetical protein